MRYPHGLGVWIVLSVLAPPTGALAAAGTPPPEVIDAVQGGRHALLIGIDRFDDEGFPDLDFAEADARGMAAALEDLGFETAQTVTTDGPSSRAELLTTIDAFLSARGPDDTVLVYVSTHGVIDFLGGERHYLAARDTCKSDLRNTGVDVDDLSDAVEDSAPRWKVLVLASCFAGAGDGSRGVDAIGGPPGGRRRGDMYQGPFPRGIRRATVQMSASYANSPAWEDPTLGHEIYTHFLIEAMRNAEDPEVDLDRDGALSAFEAHGYAAARTIKHTQGLQFPYAGVDAVGERDVLLTDAPTEEPQRGLLWILPEGVRPRGDVITDAWLDHVKLAPGSPVRGVEPGWHQMEVGSPDSRRRNRHIWFRLGRGESVTVPQVVARAEDQWLSVELGAVFVASAQAYNLINDDAPAGDPHDAPVAAPALRVSFEQRVVARQRIRGLNLGVSVAWWPGRTYDGPLGKLPARYGAIDVAVLGERRLPRWNFAFGPFIEGTYLRATSGTAAAQSVMPGLRLRAHVHLGGRLSLRVAAQLSVPRLVPFTGEQDPIFVLMPAVTAGVGVEL